MEYIIGDPSSGREVGRDLSLRDACRTAQRAGLDPQAAVYTTATWMEARQRAHEAENPPVTMAGAAGTVSDEAVARQARVNAALDAAAQAVGKSKWAHTDPVYAKGSRVNEMGVRNFEIEGKKLAEAGPLEDNARAVAGAIRAEARTAVPFNIADVRLSWYDDGTFGLKREDTGGRIAITERMLGGLMSYWPDVFGPLSRVILAPETHGGYAAPKACEEFNTFLVDRLIPRLGSARSTAASGNLLLWTRQQESGRQAFHVSSTRHTSQGFDGAAFLTTLAQAVDGAGYKGEVEYSPETGNVAFAGWMMPNHVVDLSAGDVFKYGIGGSTSDTNQGGYDIYLAAVRNLCLNLIILANEKARVYWASHISKADTVRVEMREALARAESAADNIRVEWSILRKPIPDFNAGDADHVLAVMREVRRQSGLAGGNDTVDKMVTAFNEEPGGTYADVLNALSRLHFERDLDRFQVARASGAMMPELVKLAVKNRAIVEV